MDRRTDRRTDKAGCRVVCTRLKKEKMRQRKRDKKSFLSFSTHPASQCDFLQVCYGGDCKVFLNDQHLLRMLKEDDMMERMRETKDKKKLR